MDQTLVRDGIRREDQLILVTLAMSEHADPVRENDAITDSNRRDGSSKVPARYAEFLHDLRNRFGVKRVAEWPLPVIGGLCLVLESDGWRSRSDIIVALKRMEQFETVQAVQMFTVRQQEHNQGYATVLTDIACVPDSSTVETVPASCRSLRIPPSPDVTH